MWKIRLEWQTCNGFTSRFHVFFTRIVNQWKHTKMEILEVSGCFRCICAKFLVFLPFLFLCLEICLGFRVPSERFLDKNYPRRGTPPHRTLKNAKPAVIRWVLVDKYYGTEISYHLVWDENWKRGIRLRDSILSPEFSGFDLTNTLGLKTSSLVLWLFPDAVSKASHAFFTVFFFFFRTRVNSDVN